MQKIMFNEIYGLQSAVFEGKKTQTRREPFYTDKVVGYVLNKNGKLECYTDHKIHTSHYAVGEIVAIAERYNDSMQDGSISSFDKGWNNKMFVKSELMPHHIKFTNIRCERLQDITDDDIIKEGCEKLDKSWAQGYRFKNQFDVHRRTTYFPTAQESFIELLNKLNGKKFWYTNPYVIVYEFEKID